MTREIFLLPPLKYMPPTKFMTGNIFRDISRTYHQHGGHLTSQGIQLLGMPTEAIHHPLVHVGPLPFHRERPLHLQNNMKNIGDEVEFKEGGLIRKRAKEGLLERLEKEGPLLGAREGNLFCRHQTPHERRQGSGGREQQGPQLLQPLREIMKTAVALQRKMIFRCCKHDQTPILTILAY